MSDFEKAIDIDLNNHINILVEIQPGSIRNAITGYNKWRNRILISIKSKPVKGEANKSLLVYFSSLFDCSLSDISIISGSKSRKKKIQVRYIDKNDVIKQLQKYCGE